MLVDRSAAAQAIEDFLRALGLDPEGEPQLRGTGARVAAAYADDLCHGYTVDVPSLVRGQAIAFPRGAPEVVALRDVPVTTMCPHHLMPATGTATVAFAPNEKIVGLEALIGVLDAFAHRLTLQEEVGERVVDTLMQTLEPCWAACRLVLSHTCLTARGERRHGARLETIALRGQTDAERRAALKALGVGA
jgi:GTP cyclohydrolase I